MKTALPPRRLVQCLLGAVAAAALAAVFAAYRSPELVLTLASQLWACF